VSGDTTVALAPPLPSGPRPRPTWGLAEGDALAPGRTVLRRIGGGRRYEAMLVWDEHRLAVLVAKVLRPDQAKSPAALGDLARESDLLERLAHPVVVRSFGAVRDSRFPHLLLEHLDGPTLDELIAREGALALEQLLPLALHVASALHYLAAEGVVHLDVKPSNVHLCDDARVVLTDFGIACRVDDVPFPGVFAGSPAYVAPERVDSGEFGPAADLYSLGATLFAAVEGRPPFDRGSVHATFTAVVHHAPAPFKHAGKLRPVIEGLLAKDPGRRLSADQARAALRNA
jgi:serine/threonine protein kinase